MNVGAAMVGAPLGGAAGGAAGVAFGGAGRLEPFKQLIKQHCGLQFEGDDAPRLAQALHERCTHHAVALPAYLALVQRSASELQALVNLLTINETYFFRESAQIDWLVQHLAPRLLARSQGAWPIRILSAACSTGEEPYSIALALWEKYGDHAARWFTVLGGDIDSQALARARAALYSDFSFRGVPEAVRQRHFTRTPRGWQLAQPVREMVAFHELNLLAPAHDGALQDCDVVFCRNVSIYFDTPTRRTIQHGLAALLRGEGVLVIGLAETLANDLGVLPLVEDAGLFYFAKGALDGPLHQAAQPSSSAPASPPAARPTAAAPAPLPQPLSLPQGWALPPPVAPAAPEPVAAAPSSWELALAQARQGLREKDHAAAWPHLQAVLAAQPQHPEAQVLHAYVLLERKEFAAAQAVAEQLLASDAWNVDACLLLGLAAKWQGHAAQAIRWLRQALYAQPGCWPAHFFLADLLRAQGALEQACRSWRVVLQQAAAPEAETGIRYLPLALSAQEARGVCERLLAQHAGVAGAAGTAGTAGQG